MPEPARLTARNVKVTVVFDPAQVLAAIQMPAGGDRVPIQIQVAGRTLTATLNPKTTRKALAALAAQQPEDVAVILQGKLGPGDVIEEAGLIAQPRTKPAPAAA
jgi:hypothetical protein